MNHRFLFLLVVVALVLSACATGNDAGTERTIEINMVDVAFEPSSIEVAEGETVRLRFSNLGQLPHDAFLGNADEQAEHEEQMAEFGVHAEHGAEAPNALTVEPGDTGDLVHTFTAGDAVMLGCHQPGHYDAGMVLGISVVAA